jgi:hypothetical protein
VSRSALAKIGRFVFMNPQRLEPHDHPDALKPTSSAILNDLFRNGRLAPDLEVDSCPDVEALSQTHLGDGSLPVRLPPSAARHSKSVQLLQNPLPDNAVTDNPNRLNLDELTDHLWNPLSSFN